MVDGVCTYGRIFLAEMPALQVTEDWANAGAAASIVAMAMTVILCILDALGMRGDGAGVKSTSSVPKPNERDGRWSAI